MSSGRPEITTTMMGRFDARALANASSVGAVECQLQSVAFHLGVRLFANYDHHRVGAGCARFRQRSR